MLDRGAPGGRAAVGRQGGAEPTDPCPGGLLRRRLGRRRLRGGGDHHPHQRGQLLLGRVAPDHPQQRLFLLGHAWQLMRPPTEPGSLGRR